MNNHQPNAPPQHAAISIHDLISMRIALDGIKEPSPTLTQAIAHLDQIIHAFTSSLNTGTFQ